MFLAFLLLFGSIFAAEGANQVLCPSGWKYSEGKCYLFAYETRNWTDAQEQCRKDGADLVKISSAAENDFVLRNKKSSDTWIGLHRGPGSKFYWRDGTKLTGYKNWGQGEPNNHGGKENCVHMWSQHNRRNGSWNDAQCNSKFTYVCQKQPSEVMVTCGPHQMAISFPKSLVANNYREDLTLNNKSCGASENATHFSLRTSLDECGTVAKETKNKMVYTNRVLERAVPEGSIITRVRPLEITFSCSYPRRDRISAIGIRPNYRTLKFTVRKNGEFSYALDIFPNRKFKRPFKKFPVSVNLRQVLFIQASLKTADKQLTISTEQCFATPRRNPNSKPVHTLIANSCPVDKTVTYLPSPTPDVRRFSVEAFKIVRSPYVFLHCKIVICNASDTSSACNKQCPPRGQGKREIISIPKHIVTGGPLTFEDTTLPELELENDVVNEDSMPLDTNTEDPMPLDTDTDTRADNDDYNLFT